MRIGIDARSLSEITSGPSRVISLLIENFLQHDDTNEYIIFINEHYKYTTISRESYQTVRYSRNNLFHDFFFSRYLHNYQLDILLSPHNWTLGFKTPNSTNVTIIHDLFHLLDKKHFQKYGILTTAVRLYFKLYSFLTIRNSDLLVTVSNHSKSTIANYYHERDLNIIVSLNAPGIEPGLFDQLSPSEKVHTPSEYLLYVGNFRNYKNVDTLLLGYHHFLTKYPTSQLKLIIVSNDNPSLIVDLCDQLQITDKVIVLQNINDIQLASLYNNAKIFIFPSRFEGFGIPVLEAAMFKTPIIISDAEALVEITDGTALIFNQSSHLELSVRIHELLSNPSLAKSLVDAAYVNAQKFSWRKSAIDFIEELNNHLT